MQETYLVLPALLKSLSGVERIHCLKASFSSDVVTGSSVLIFLLMLQNVVQSTKDVYGVNLSDVPSEDDLTIYTR